MKLSLIEPKTADPCQHFRDTAFECQGGEPKKLRLIVAALLGVSPLLADIVRHQFARRFNGGDNFPS
ncbi:MAG: hypothetical protein WA863_17350, partial [Methyloceanibacter sp.]